MIRRDVFKGLLGLFCLRPGKKKSRLRTVALLGLKNKMFSLRREGDNHLESLKETLMLNSCTHWREGCKVGEPLRELEMPSEMCSLEAHADRYQKFINEGTYQVGDILLFEDFGVVVIEGDVT